MEDLSYHILDIAENSIKADAGNIRIKITEDTEKDELKVVIKDDGRGIGKATLKRIRDPFYTTRTTRRVGMGISLLEQAANQARGRLNISSTPGKGTTISATFRHSHIDRQPIGELSSSLVTLIAGNPDVNIRYTHDINGKKFSFSTSDIKKQLDGMDINNPHVLGALKKLIHDNEAELGN
jgi:hypothetical protein